MNEKIRAVACRVGEDPEIIEIENTLEAFQQFVGGHIETTGFCHIPGVAVICNDEGKIIPLAPNWSNGMGDFICGDFLLVGLGEEDFTGLTDYQILRIKSEFLM